MPSKLYVIGIGDDGVEGLSEEARAVLDGATVLAGGKRVLGLLAAHPAQKIEIGANPSEPLERLRQLYRRQNCVVLASGDPLFFGIGGRLLEAIPRDDLVFLPHLSSIQLAFSRARETWHDAVVISVHGRPMDALIAALDRGDEKIAVLTDDTNDPAAVARLLIARGCDRRYRMWIGEHLGGHKERITTGSAAQIVRQSFSPLNVVLLLPNRSGPLEQANMPLAGIADEAFVRRGNLITKREIRLIVLGYLELRKGNIVWDIGAGSGAVSIEAARWSSDLTVYAVEKSASAIAKIEENLRRFSVTNVAVIHGEAPDCLAELPDPDAVFLGGSGGSLQSILEAVMRRLKGGGRIVANCLTMETFSRAWEALSGWQPQATSVQLARSRRLGQGHCFEPDHPLIILRARKP
ncbi:MAG: precorrin-6Y C5,15-methyltransferase [Gemmatales bacterium]|nr:MAG: precorrin-6Y C5,15-methyltransferase [Gemmatales bacterium]